MMKKKFDQYWNIHDSYSLHDITPISGFHSFVAVVILVLGASWFTPGSIESKDSKISYPSGERLLHNKDLSGAYFGPLIQGYADAVVAENSTKNPGSSLHEPVLIVSDNSYYTKFDKNEDYLVLDLTDIIPEGSTISIYWGSDDGKQSEIGVQGSLNGTDYENGTDFSNVQIFESSADLDNNNPVQTISLFQVSGETRYLRFTRISGKPGLNGVRYIIGEADLGITKTVDSSTKSEGDHLTYTINVTNHGPDDAIEITIIDLLPPQVEYLSSSAGASYDHNTGVWTIGSLSALSTSTLTINARVKSGTAGQTVTNTATASSIVNEPTNASYSNDDQAVFQVNGADLEITKSILNSPPFYVDDLITFRIQIKNNGPSSASGIQVIDELPAQLNYISSNASEGSFNPSSGLWSGISLSNGESQTLNITMQVLSAEGFSNQARIVSSSQMDSKKENNSASVFSSVYGTFESGACIIDLSNNSSYNAGLAPYGLVYDLVKNKGIPVEWAINPNKSFVNPTNKIDQKDFTINGIDYYSGAFIIKSEFAGLPVVQSTISTWINNYPGLTVRCNQAAFSAPIHGTMTSFPRAALDEQNGDKAVSAFFGPAGISQFFDANDPSNSPYYTRTPSTLEPCDDIYIMPHADPHEWNQNDKDAFADFISEKGWLYGACHAVSALEWYFDLDNDGVRDMNLLSNAGLIPWENDAVFGTGVQGHGDGTPPYSYSISPGSDYGNLASDPIMQYMGTTDGALLNGSEQIFIPLTEGWRSSTTVAVWDPDHPEATGPYPSGAAALVAYGKAFGNDDLGMVLYQASHTFAGGTTQENIGAARLLGNFWFQSGLGSKPQIQPVLSVSEAGIGEIVTFSANVTNATAPVTYEWTSDCGGTFSNPYGASTDFITPNVSEETTCIIRLKVTDACNRFSFFAQALTIFPVVDIEINKSAPISASTGSTFNYTLTVTNNGPSRARDVTLEDVLPEGFLNPSYTIDGGIPSAWPASNTLDLGDMNNGTSISVVISGTVDHNQCNPLFNMATVSTTSEEDDLTNNSDDVSTEIVDGDDPTVLSCPIDVTVNGHVNSCGATVYYEIPSFEDNCDDQVSATLTEGLASGSFFPPGPTEIVFQAYDDEGNGPVECTFTINVNVAGPYINFIDTICSSDLMTYTVLVESNGTITASEGIVTNTAGNEWQISDIATGTDVLLTSSLNGSEGYPECVSQLLVNSPACPCPPQSNPWLYVVNQGECGQIPLRFPLRAYLVSGYYVEWYDVPEGGEPVGFGNSYYPPTEDVADYGEYVYYAEAVNILNGCSYQDRIAASFTRHEEPTASLESDEVCLGDEASLTPTYGGGTSPYTFQWYIDDSRQTNSIDNLLFTPEATGIYDIRVTVIDRNRCRVNAEATLTVNDLQLELVTGDLTICSGDNTSLSVNATQGSGSYGYDWTIEAGDITSIDAGAQTAMASVSPGVTTTYKVKVTDLNTGCTDSTSVTVVVSCSNLVTVKSLESVHSTVDQGDIVTFEINVTNLGPGTATNVVVNEFLPEGLTLLNVTKSVGTYNNIIDQWAGFDLAPNDSESLFLEVRVDEGQAGNTITNTISSAVSDQLDPTTEGDDLEETIDVNPVFNLNGNVFHDTDGGTINGEGINHTGINPLYITLVDISGIVVGSTTVNSDGSYLMENVAIGDYTVILSINEGIAGQPGPLSELPESWQYMGEGMGPDAIGDGTPDGSQSISVSTSDLTHIDFALYLCTDLTITYKVGPSIVIGDLIEVECRVVMAELNDVTTDGSTVAVFIPKSNLYTLMPYEESMTHSTGLPVLNNDWNYYGEVGSNYVFVYTANNGIMVKSGLTAFGFKIMYSANNAAGIENVVARLFQGSGGECNINNNTDSETFNFSF